MKLNNIFRFLDSPVPHTAATFLTQIPGRSPSEAIAVAWFAIGYSTSEVTLVEMFAGPASVAPIPPVQTMSVRQGSFVTRFLSSVPLLSGGHADPGEMLYFVQIHRSF